MLYHERRIPGAYLIEPETYQDERGFFTTVWSQRDFPGKHLEPPMKQCHVIYNREYGTLRGLHIQLPPYAETKLIRCIRGAIYNVIVDLRSGSPTFLQWHAVELSDENYISLFIPGGLAHGFLTLYDETEVLYQTSEFHFPEAVRGIRWNDPRFHIRWPGEVRFISSSDENLPDFDPARLAGIRYEETLNTASIHAPTS
jgi:dTDP-4-dehydrorhamnose 3,5-epimerase